MTEFLRHGVFWDSENRYLIAEEIDATIVDLEVRADAGIIQPSRKLIASFALESDAGLFLAAKMRGVAEHPNSDEDLD